MHFFEIRKVFQTLPKMTLKHSCLKQNFPKIFRDLKGIWLQSTIFKKVIFDESILKKKVYWKFRVK